MKFLLVLGCLGCCLSADDSTAAKHAMTCYVFVAGGSGVVVDPSGLILTNHHVVDGEDHLVVRWHDGVSAPARVLGLDPVGDLALLLAPRPDGTTPAALLGNASDLVPGAPVFAIGNPFGLGDLDDVPTLTRGVLSTGRLVRGDYADTLQLDAPVNPGNSGGPLFSLSGRLLGINGQIRSRTGFRINSGIGLAIACTQIADFLPLLKEAQGGFVRHAAPPSGLELRDGPAGPTVGAPGSTDLHNGDILLTIAGRTAASAEQARGCFAALAWRESLKVEVTYRRGTTNGACQLAASRGIIPGRPYYGWSIAERADRIQVTGVDPDSPAARAGLRRGDVLIALDGKPLGPRIDLLRALVKAEPGDRLLLRRRASDGTEQEVTLLVRRVDGTP
ncbi:MAG: trypsin-like peptidase domain-containing protein [Planctomycetota bacterium]